MPDDPPEEKHEHKPLDFPEGFLWGAATAAHQVEGNNTNSDWWDWELKYQPPNKRSGRACDQYNLFEKDFDLAQSLNHNAHRLSIEWARIQPKEDSFDYNEIDHYKKVLKALKDRGFKVMLTLWHFTLPKWVADKGGWENSKTIDLYIKYLEKIIPEIKDYVDFFITLNEPGIYAYTSYLEGKWPPNKKSKVSCFLVQWHFVQAHKKAYQLIKSHIDTPIGIANNLQTYNSTHKHSVVEQASVYISDILTNHSFYLMTQGCHDFMGINYYFHHRYNKVKGFLPRVEEVAEFKKDVSDLGWEIYPEGIFDVLNDFKNHIPIYITECGIASTNDDRRTRFLIQYLHEIYRAIKAGVNVKGFFYWSLLDNFEWADGFEPRFGLVNVDYKTMERKPRPSAYVYGDIARHNKLMHSLLKLLGHTVRAEEVLCGLHDSPKAFCEHIPQ